MYLVVDGGMVQQVNHSLLFGLLLPLAPPDSLLDAKVQVSRCLGLVLPEVCQIRVSEMPKNEVDCSKLFSNAIHTWSTFLRFCTVSSRVSQRLYASSPPATSMRAHCLSSGIWSATKITSIRRLKTFQAATLSAALQFISGYFSLGTDGMFAAIRRSFQDHEGKLDEIYLSNN